MSVAVCCGSVVVTYDVENGTGYSLRDDLKTTE